MQSECPYCSLAKTRGEVFCSRHSSNMHVLKSGVFSIETDSFEECDWHVTRLSLNFNLDGPQTYFAGGRTFSISPGKYLLLNEGQKFKTYSQSPTQNRMVTVAFQVGLAEQLLHSLVAKEEAVLDSPFTNSKGTTEFLEETYALDPTIYTAVEHLLEFAGEDFELQQKLEDLLMHVLRNQLRIRKEISSISKAKTTTKVEIYRRLHWSLEFLHDNYNKDISVDVLAEHACLSTFHYKRLFTELFKISPYQYLINLRLEKACSLLHSGERISKACKEVGWKDPSSFARLFKKKYQVTPAQFKSSSSTL